MSRLRRRYIPEVGGSGRRSALSKMEAVLRLLQGAQVDSFKQYRH